MVWLIACAAPAPTEPLTLRWHAAFEGERWEEARAGLAWALSLLGGVPPADGSWIEEGPDDTFTLSFSAAGLDPALLTVDATDDLRLFGALDLGRWLMATLYQPAVYYRSTGACGTLDDWSEAHPTGDVFIATVSAIVPDERRIELRTDPADAGAVAFAATAISTPTQTAGEREVLDLMPSGQQRFAIYGEDGMLVAASSAASVGPTGRCIWCHEGSVMPLIVAGEAVDGALTPAEFSAQVEIAQSRLDSARAGLDTEVDFETYEVHEWAEKLAEGFLAPPASRVAWEWGVDEAEVQAWLDGATTATNPEYGDDLARYARADVDDALHRRLEAAGDAWDPPATAADSRSFDAASVTLDPADHPCE